MRVQFLNLKESCFQSPGPRKRNEINVTHDNQKPVHPVRKDVLVLPPKGPSFVPLKINSAPVTYFSYEVDFTHVNL